MKVIESDEQMSDIMDRHKIVVICDPERGPAGIEGMRQRLPV